MRYFLLMLLGLLAGPLRAQPGGGGGLQIRGVYAVAAGRLVPIDSAALRVRVFLLDSTRDTYHARITQELRPPDFRYLHSPRPQRLYLIYHADTMLLDVAGMMRPNPVGYCSHLDSLVVLPGHFSYHFPGWNQRFGHQPDPPASQNKSSVSDTRSQTFTPSALPYLLAQHLLTYRRRLSFSFLTPSQLPAGYYADLASRWLGQHQPDSALAALARAQSRLPAAAHLSLYTAQATAYQQLHNYPRAIDLLSQVITALRSQAAAPGTYPYGLITAYRQRRQLYLLTHQPSQALADYDAASALAPGKAQDEAISRAFFLAESLHQPAEFAHAARLLRTRLPALQANEWACESTHDLHYRQYELSLTYFQLAQAEYGQHQYPAAFRYWAQSMAAGQAHNYAREYVAHFDSLLVRWPAQPQLLLGRALASLSEDSGRQPAQRDVAPLNALHDLDQAAQHGLSGFELNFYRYLALRRLGRWAEARQQLDLAISQKPGASELYLARFEVRYKLNEARYDDPADPDQLTAQRLCRSSSR